MKSRNILLMMVMASVALTSDPVPTQAENLSTGITVARSGRRNRRPSRRTAVKKQPVVKVAPVSMESFVEGKLDKEGVKGLAYQSIRTKEFRDKEPLFRKALEYFPDDQQIIRGAITVFENEGKAEDAIPLYNVLLQNNPDDVALNLQAAQAFFWTGRNSDAVRCYEMVLKTGRANNKITERYAKALVSDSQDALGAAQYRKLIDSNYYRTATGPVVEEMFKIIDRLTETGNKSEAEKNFDYLVKTFPDNPEVKERNADKLSQAALRAGNLDEALRKSRIALQVNPDNRTSLLTAARVSSWQHDYAAALESYDRLIALPVVAAPAAGATPYQLQKAQGDAKMREVAMREKARVLGWKGAYGAALEQYAQAKEAFPDVEAVAAEAKAKHEYYKNAYRPAVKAYKEWIKVDPEEPEAAFDLGQLYMQHAHWGDAADVYGKMVKEMPYQPNAPVALDKTNILSSMTQLDVGGDYYRVNSEWKNINYQTKGAHAGVTIPFSESFLAFTGVDIRSYSFETLDRTYNPENLTIGMVLRSSPSISVRTAYTLHKFYPELPDSHTGYLEVTTLPFNDLHFNVSYRHEDVYDNATTFLSHLQANRWNFRTLYDRYLRWNIGMDVETAALSDGNSSVTMGADVTAHLLYGRNQLDVRYRLENFGYSELRQDYWTPDTYTVNSLGMSFRHYFNEELYMGANNTWYELGYRANFEPNNNVSHQVHAGLYHDWNKRFSTAVSGHYTWATALFYEDRFVSADVRWFF